MSPVAAARRAVERGVRALAPPDDGSGDSSGDSSGDGSGDGSNDGSGDGSGRRGAVEILAVAITTGPALEIERSSHHDAAETERFMSPVQRPRGAWLTGSAPDSAPGAPM